MIHTKLEDFHREKTAEAGQISVEGSYSGNDRKR